MDVFATIVAEAERESPLWRRAVRPSEEREPLPVFSPLGEERFALGLESIYEGYLLHYGRPRVFAAADRDSAVLLGDYLYAHGLVRIADVGQAEVVADLADLLSLCAHLRAEGRPGDGAAWATTVALLGRARAARVLTGDGEDALLDLAARAAGAAAVRRALELHAARVN